MKKIAVLIMCIMIFGCAHSPMHFQLPPGSTQNDFKQAKIDCGESPGGGGFIFGPLIIVTAAVAVIESIEFSKRHTFQDCMEGKGFKCVTNCMHVSSVQLPPVDSQKLNKWKQTIQADQKREWTLFSKNAKGSLFYYDPSSLLAEDHRYVYFREMVKFSPDLVEDFSFVWRSSKVNCIDKIFQFSDFAALDKNGNIRDPGVREAKWRNLPEGYSLGSFIYKICEEAIIQGTKGAMQAPSLKQNIVDNSKTAMVTSLEIKKDSRFIDNGNGTVTDTKTGLMWASKDNGSNIKWEDAKNYCDNYRAGGYQDWRMPTLNELEMLYDSNKIRLAACERSSVIHIATDLIDITCNYLWTSETRMRLSLIPIAAYICFDDGSRDWLRQSYDYYYRVLPVRSSN